MDYLFGERSGLQPGERTTPVFDYLLGHVSSEPETALTADCIAQTMRQTCRDPMEMAVIATEAAAKSSAARAAETFAATQLSVATAADAKQAAKAFAATQASAAKRAWGDVHAQGSHRKVPR